MVNTVLLKKTQEASPVNLSGRPAPASYDVYVNDVKVGSLDGRSPGRGASRPFHEFRDLSGNRLSGCVAVRGPDRERLNALAVDLYKALPTSA